MDRYTSFYQQAQWDLNSLISIRKQWDRYLVSRETPEASQIPISFVNPSPPSDSIWATALSCRRRTLFPSL
jgi:hypothetical protein